jgi:hypothetical protein
MNISEINAITTVHYGFPVFNRDHNSGFLNGAGEKVVGKARFQNANVIIESPLGRDVKAFSGNSSRDYAQLFNEIFVKLKEFKYQGRTFKAKSIHVDIPSSLMVLGSVE